MSHAYAHGETKTHEGLIRYTYIMHGNHDNALSLRHPRPACTPRAALRTGCNTPSPHVTVPYVQKPKNKVPDPSHGMDLCLRRRNSRIVVAYLLRGVALGPLHPRSTAMVRHDEPRMTWIRGMNESWNRKFDRFDQRKKKWLFFCRWSNWGICFFFGRHKQRDTHIYRVLFVFGSLSLEDIVYIDRVYSVSTWRAVFFCVSENLTVIGHGDTAHQTLTGTATGCVHVWPHRVCVCVYVGRPWQVASSDRDVGPRLRKINKSTTHRTHRTLTGTATDCVMRWCDVMHVCPHHVYVPASVRNLRFVTNFVLKMGTKTSERPKKDMHTYIAKYGLENMYAILPLCAIWGLLCLQNGDEDKWMPKKR
jgi:hypothetical protein